MSTSQLPSEVGRGPGAGAGQLPGRPRTVSAAPVVSRRFSPHLIRDLSRPSGRPSGRSHRAGAGTAPRPRPRSAFPPRQRPPGAAPVITVSARRPRPRNLSRNEQGARPARGVHSARRRSPSGGSDPCRRRWDHRHSAAAAPVPQAAGPRGTPSRPGRGCAPPPTGGRTRRQRLAERREGHLSGPPALSPCINASGVAGPHICRYFSFFFAARGAASGRRYRQKAGLPRTISTSTSGSCRSVPRPGGSSGARQAQTNQPAGSSAVPRHVGDAGGEVLGPAAGAWPPPAASEGEDGHVPARRRRRR